MTTPANDPQRGQGIGPFGKAPYGSGAQGGVAFGVVSVEVIHMVPVYGHIIRVTFSTPVLPDTALYDPGNFQITVRFGKARPIFVKRVLPNNDTAPIYVDLVLHNPVQNRGQYRLTVRHVKSLSGVPIDPDEVV